MWQSVLILQQAVTNKSMYGTLCEKSKNILVHYESDN